MGKDRWTGNPQSSRPSIYPSPWKGSVQVITDDVCKMWRRTSLLNHSCIQYVIILKLRFQKLFYHIEVGDTCYWLLSKEKLAIQFLYCHTQPNINLKCITFPLRYLLWFFTYCVSALPQTWKVTSSENKMLSIKFSFYTVSRRPTTGEILVLKIVQNLDVIRTFS